MTDTSNHAIQAGHSNDEAGVLAALDNAEMAIFVLDSTFTVQWLNSTAATYFGLNREAVVGRDKRQLIESTIKSIFEQPDRFAETVSATYDNNSYIEEFECHILPDENREERWLRHRSRPIEAGPFAGGRVEHYTDITEQKANEQTLRQERDRFAEFAGVVSHDLRNPLNIAQGRLELAAETGDGSHFEHVEDALTRMERIIDDVLWLAQNGRDIGTTEPIALRSAVEAAWELVDGDPTADLIVDIAAEETIVADDDRFDQLLENLLSNAIDHGGEEVTVRVESTEGGFAIADDGPGIDPADRERIFEAGYSAAVEGTGLGLEIVSQIVDGHGWEIAVTESKAGGARFAISGIDC